MFSGKTYGIHIHTLDEPTAEEAFRRIPFRFRQLITWIYVPFSAADHLQMVALRWPIAEVNGRWYEFHCDTSYQVRKYL